MVLQVTGTADGAIGLIRAVQYDYTGWISFSSINNVESHLATICQPCEGTEEYYFLPFTEMIYCWGICLSLTCPALQI